MSIIDHHILVPQGQVQALKAAFQQEGYSIHDLSVLGVAGLAFDVNHLRDLSHFRFTRNGNGDLTGLISPAFDDCGIYNVLEILCPFVPPSEHCFVICTGEHQEEHEGVFLRPDGLYEAVNICITAECGSKKVFEDEKEEEDA